MQKILIVATMLLAASPALAQAPACLRATDIASSKPARDDKAILFKMNNGQIWRNDLRGACSGISFNGFSWVLQGDGSICENMQSLTVRQTGSVCLLGKFTQLPKPVSGN